MESSRESVGSGIIYTTGNLLESTSQCLVNPVNTVGVMGAGLALAFRHKYPTMFQTYKQLCHANALHVGQIMFYRLRAEDRIICLFPTKEDWRNKSQFEYIDTGLQAFVKYYKDWDITSAAFPKLGCGLGGLDWESHIQPLMERRLGDLPIRIEIFI